MQNLHSLLQEQEEIKYKRSDKSYSKSAANFVNPEKAEQIK